MERFRVFSFWYCVILILAQLFGSYKSRIMIPTGRTVTAVMPGEDFALNSSGDML
jgi:hypothetical protein